MYQNSLMRQIRIVINILASRFKMEGKSRASSTRIIFPMGDQILILLPSIFNTMPKGNNSKGSDDDFQFKRREDFNFDLELKTKKETKTDLYKCGDTTCGKFYHSYTAFYNHCKKSHGGEFPENSVHNGKNFEGPSKNRGRPRIKKNETKDEGQIQSMKRENELIQFLGTLKTKKAEELIVYVENPIERLETAVIGVQEQLTKNGEHCEEKSQYLHELQIFNRMIAGNDLPEFYDPIESELYKDKLDSYNFTSIYNFMTTPQKRQKFDIHYEGVGLLYRILQVWLARILSQKLLAEVIYTVVQIQFGVKEVKEKELLQGKSEKFREITEKFFQCFGVENEEGGRSPQQ